MYTERIHITQNGYVYNYDTGKMYKVTPDVKRILFKYNDIGELEQDNHELYRKMKPLIDKILEENQRSKNNYKVSGISRVQLILCNYCNLACKYCYANAGTYNKPKMKMTKDIAEKAIDFFFSKYEYIDTISFFGGESLLCIGLIDYICDYLKKKYPDRYRQIGLMTNLFELSEEAIGIIRKYKIHVSTSLDGDRKLNALRVTPDGKESYKKVLDNIQRLQKEVSQPEAIEVTMSGIHSDNKVNQKSVKNILQSITSVQNYTINPVESFNDNSAVREYVNDVEDEQVDIETFIDTGVCDMRINDIVSIISGIGPGELFCSSGTGQFTIFPNGDIYPCHMYILDNSTRYKMGNVNSLTGSEFDEAVKAVEKLNLKNNYDRCRKCKAKRICTSCIGMRLSKNEETIIPHENEYCRKKEGYMDSLIEEYASLLDDKEKYEEFKRRMKNSVALSKQVNN